MPRTIEHQIKLLDRPSTPPSSGHSPSPYGSPSAIDVQSHFPSEAEQAWRMGNSGTSSMRVPEKPARKHRQHQPIHQTNSRQADEVAYGTESFERNLRYSPNEIERQHFSSRSFGDQRSMGGDGESRANVRFEEEPARPIDLNYENPDPFDHRTHRSSWSDEEKQNVGRDETRLLQRTKHLDTQPIRIPRPHVDKTSSIPSPASHKQRISQPVQSSSASFSPGRQSWRTAATSSSGFGRSSVEDPERMTRDRDVPTADLDASSTSSQPSGGLYWATGVPMKKVIRKSRWISIHDGRPKSDFVETVHYVPAFSGDNTTSRPRHKSAQPRHAHFNIPAELWTSSSSCSLSSTDEVKPSSGRGEPNVENRRKEVGHRQPQQNSIVYVTHNPIYSIGL